MPERSAQVPYSGVPTVTPDNAGGGPINAQATPAEFGGLVAGATEKLGGALTETGDKGMAMATHYAQMATEAKVNDAIANQWAPEAAQLRAGFDQLRGQDKIAGYDPYIKSLQDARRDFIANAKSPYEKELLGNYITKHIATEIDGARREQVAETIRFEDESHASKIMTDSGFMADHYNDPPVVDSGFKMIDGQVQKHGMDRGQSQDEIDQSKRQANAGAAIGMFNKAIMAADPGAASDIYHDWRHTMPGDVRQHAETVLHQSIMRQYGDTAVQALVTGDPIPPHGGPTALEARTATVDAARTNGVDPNDALTVLRIESNDGRNVGKRGDIGQTGLGGTLEEQAHHLTSALSSAGPIADKALGRPAEPWERYAVYQQGHTGGAALLKASTDDPMARAVDVLKPLYKSPKDALAAIQNNGGNATMTSGQFLDMIHQRYDANADRARISTDEKMSPELQEADKAASPYEKGGLTVQPAVTATGRLMEFNKVYPSMLERANAIPNIDARDGTLKALEHKRTVLSAEAQAEKGVLAQKALTMAADPSFTDMKQVPPELLASLADDPMMLMHLESRAEYNLKRSSGLEDPDLKKFGPKYFDIMKGISPIDGSKPTITNTNQLLDKLYNTHEITQEGFDRLLPTLAGGKKSIDADGLNIMRTATFSAVKTMVSGEDTNVGMKDPKGEFLFASATAMVEKAIVDGRAHVPPIPDTELFDSKSKNWVGHAADNLVRTLEERNKDLAVANMEDIQPKERGFFGKFFETQSERIDDISSDIKSGKLSGKDGLSALQDEYKSASKEDREKIGKLAIIHGLVRPDVPPPEAPAVPKPE